MLVQAEDVGTSPCVYSVKGDPKSEVSCWFLKRKRHLSSLL